MKKILSYIAISLFLFSTTGCAQTKQVTDTVTISTGSKDSAFRLINRIPGKFVYMNVDILDNIYLIPAGSSQLLKLNNHGDSLAAFNDVKRNGNPSYIDVSNPLKILVYYKYFSTVVSLDRLLTYRNSISLPKKGIFNTQAIASSYDNNIWIFDEQDFKIKKLDDEGNTLQESSDMRMLLDSVPSPQQITDCNNNVFLYDPNKGFYIFDYYGALKNNLPFRGWKNIAVSQQVIYGFSGNQLLSYELNSLTLKKYELPPFINNYASIRAINGKLYLLKSHSVEIYSVN